MMLIKDFQSINGFDERFFLYCEDMDLCRTIYENNYSVVVDSKIKVTHTHKKASRKAIKLFIIHLYSFFLYYYKWGLANPKKIKDINSNFKNCIK